VATHLRRYTGHTGSAETVKHNIPRLRVMEDVTHDGLMRYLGVIGVRVVNWVVFPLTHIGRKWLSVIVIVFRLFRLLRLPFSYEVGNPWVRAGGVIRRIAQIQDVFVAADGKAFDLAELRVLQLLAQLLGKVGAASLVVLEGHAEASHRAGGLLRLFKQRVEQTGFFHLHNPWLSSCFSLVTLRVTKLGG